MDCGMNFTFASLLGGVLIRDCLESGFPALDRGDGLERGCLATSRRPLHSIASVDIRGGPRHSGGGGERRQDSAEPGRATAGQD
eukprot:CAMPEP_0194545970 /NCGR_PEP_ID=MMETSP0253-20130528/89970_1 /TAXON_ID=2966 /ORGANISM="Noctiluca scintillans" /LENGTH=83 /DNA_ID=CAMNT_0039393017 /DNA_START=160 /DNA_END=408 /DNA_ORIENTATION=+